MEKRLDSAATYLNPGYDQILPSTHPYGEKPLGEQGSYSLVERNYGKNFVKVLYVSRSGRRHAVKEVEVSTRLTLGSNKDFLTGDNGDIVATDTQKNIVYVLAKKYGVKSPEEFGLAVSEFFLSRYGQVEEAEVRVEEAPWERIPSRGRQHNHAFIFAPTAQRHALVTRARNGKVKVTSGIEGLRVLKTTQSSFTDFHSDEYRTLPDAQDRIFSTIITSSWTYSSHEKLDFDKEWLGVRDSILEEFAGNPDTGVLSASVQHTLYLAEKNILDKHPEIEEIHLDMPNKHYWNVDLSMFPEEMVGHGTNKSVFLPVDKPSGHIHAVLARTPRAKL